jgi:hypothetical protein
MVEIRQGAKKLGFMLQLEINQCVLTFLWVIL